MKKYFVIILFFGLFACQKEVEINIKDALEQYVIDANLSDFKGSCIVKISKTSKLSSIAEFPKISDAIVKIKDSKGVISTLKETEKGIYTAPELIGISGETYFLEVIVDGKTFTAKSTPPKKVPIEAIDFLTQRGESTPIIKFQDPIDSGNKYRYLVYLDGKAAGTTNLINDNSANGQKIVQDIELDNQGPATQRAKEMTIEFQCIDQAVYEYYFVVNELIGANFIFASTPSNPTTNIVGKNVLGVFSAHTTEFKKVDLK